MGFDASNVLGSYTGTSQRTVTVSDCDCFFVIGGSSSSYMPRIDDVVVGSNSRVMLFVKKGQTLKFQLTSGSTCIRYGTK